MSTQARKNPVLPIWYAVTALLCLGYVAFPFFYTLRSATFVDGSFTLDVFGEFFANPNHVQVAVNSAVLGLGTVLMCGILGTMLALYMTFLAGKRKMILHILLLSPMMIPGVITVIAFIQLYGESGLFTKALQMLLNLPSAPYSFKGFGAILFVIAYTQYVYFYLNVYVALKYLDYAQVEAARSLGASWGRVFKDVIFPVIKPAVLLSTILTFTSGVSSFSGPNLIGGYKVLSTQIVLSKVNNHLEMASVQAVVMFAISIAVMLLVRWYGRRTRSVQADRTATKVVPLRAHPALLLATRIVVAVQILLILLPIAAIVYLSFMTTGSIMQEIFPHSFTLENYQTIFAKPRVLQPLLNSLEMATLAVAAGLLITVPSAYALVRRPSKAGAVVRFLLMLPAALPASLIAINLINAFATENVFAFNVPLIGSFVILPIAYTIMALPMLLSSNEVAIGSLHRSLEEASKSLGAGPLRTFLHVIVPNTMPGILAGGVLMFIRMIGEYTMSALLYGIHNRPISISIVTNMQEYETGISLAYGVLVILVCYAALAVIFRLDKNRFV